MDYIVKWGWGQFHMFVMVAMYCARLRLGRCKKKRRLVTMDKWVNHQEIHTTICPSATHSATGMQTMPFFAVPHSANKQVLTLCCQEFLFDRAPITKRC